MPSAIERHPVLAGARRDRGGGGCSARRPRSPIEPTSMRARDAGVGGHDLPDRQPRRRVDRACRPPTARRRATAPSIPTGATAEANHAAPATSTSDAAAVMICIAAGRRSARRRAGRASAAAAASGSGRVAIRRQQRLEARRPPDRARRSRPRGSRRGRCRRSGQSSVIGAACRAAASCRDAGSRAPSRASGPCARQSPARSVLPPGAGSASRGTRRAARGSPPARRWRRRRSDAVPGDSRLSGSSTKSAVRRWKSVARLRAIIAIHPPNAAGSRRSSSRRHAVRKTSWTRSSTSSRATRASSSPWTTRAVSLVEAR